MNSNWYFIDKEKGIVKTTHVFSLKELLEHNPDFYFPKNKTGEFCFAAQLDSYVRQYEHPLLKLYKQNYEAM